MADHFYSVLKGDGFDPATVVVGAASSGESIELRVHDGDSLANTKLNILNALATLEAYFQTPSNTITA